MKEKIIEQLNKLLKLDKNLTQIMVDNRYQVSDSYYLSSEFVCMEDRTAGLVGILNGLLPQDDFRIAACYGDDELSKLTGFTLVRK